MIDKAVYIGTGGAKNAMTQLGILTNNLANLNTVGFRGDFEIMKHTAASEGDHQSRTQASIGSSSTDFTRGPKLTTGRDLDIAINDQGFIAVQSKTGKEAYTRAGDLQLTADGYLSIRAGELVMGEGGPINLPKQMTMFNIGPDGTLSGRLPGTKDMVNFGRIKFVNPDVADLHKGKDGLFYYKGDSTAPIDRSVTVTGGVLEGSNVNAVDTLTKLIDLSRHYEMQSNLMKNLGDNASSANQILSVTK